MGRLVSMHELVGRKWKLCLSLSATSVPHRHRIRTLGLSQHPMGGPKSITTTKLATTITTTPSLLSSLPSIVNSSSLIALTLGHHHTYSDKGECWQLTAGFPSGNRPTAGNQTKSHLHSYNKLTLLSKSPFQSPLESFRLTVVAGSSSHYSNNKVWLIVFQFVEFRNSRALLRLACESASASPSI